MLIKPSLQRCTVSKLSFMDGLYLHQCRGPIGNWWWRARIYPKVTQSVTLSHSGSPSSPPIRWYSSSEMFLSFSIEEFPDSSSGFQTVLGINRQNSGGFGDPPSMRKRKGGAINRLCIGKTKAAASTILAVASRLKWEWHPRKLMVTPHPNTCIHVSAERLQKHSNPVHRLHCCPTETQMQFDTKHLAHAHHKAISDQRWLLLQ